MDNYTQKLSGWEHTNFCQDNTKKTSKYDISSSVMHQIY